MRLRKHISVREQKFLRDKDIKRVDLHELNPNLFTWSCEVFQRRTHLKRHYMERHGAVIHSLFWLK